MDWTNVKKKIMLGNYMIYILTRYVLGAKFAVQVE